MGSATQTITANYVEQYWVGFVESGLDSSATGSIVIVNSAKSYTSLPFGIWANSGDTITYEYATTVSSTTSGKQFRLDSVSSSSLPPISGPTTVEGTFLTQWQITFTQSGVEIDFTGAVVIVEGISYDRSGLTSWRDSGTPIFFTYATPLVVTPGVKQYVLTTVDTTSPLVPSSPQTVTGTYATQ